MNPFWMEIKNQPASKSAADHQANVLLDLWRELREKTDRITEISAEKENWKQRYIGLLISGLEAHEIEEYVDELECLD